MWSIWSQVTSSPRPSSPRPRRRTTVVILVKPLEVSRTIGVNSTDSISTGSPAILANVLGAVASSIQEGVERAVIASASSGSASFSVIVIPS